MSQINNTLTIGSANIESKVSTGKIENADILIENFKPGTMEKWGLGYEEVLRARFPKLIHCRVSGFGGDGPSGVWGSLFGSTADDVPTDGGGRGEL